MSGGSPPPGGRTGTGADAPPKHPAPGPRPDGVGDRAPGLPWRRKLLGVGLALATACAVVSLMTDPPGGVHRNPPPRAEKAPCPPGQTAGCVGGLQGVIVVAPGPAAPAPPAASR